MIVRYLTRDDAKQATIAERLFERCERGDLTLVILPVVLAECVFVLESFYERERADIGRVLTAMIDTPVPCRFHGCQWPAAHGPLSWCLIVFGWL